MLRCWSSNVVYFLVPGYCTCSSRAPPVWSYGQSVLWFSAASLWALRTTSSPWWTVTSSLLFFKVRAHAYTHILGAWEYLLQRTALWTTGGDVNPEMYLCFVLAGLLCPDLIFIEACLRCLRTVFISPVTPVQLLYTVGCLAHVPLTT